MTEALLRGAIHGGLGVLAVAIVCLGLPRLSPSLRGWLWRLANLKFAVAAAFVLTLPLLPQAPLAPADPEPIHIETISPVAGAPSVALPTEEAPWPWWEDVWLAGVLVGGVRFARQVAASRRLRRECDPDGKGNATHPQVASPVLLGILRPLVVLPPGLSPEHREMALAHERAHVVRRDPQWAVLARIVAILFWFVPLAAWSARQAQNAAEEACDERALGQTGADPIRYAEMLLAYARRGTSPSVGMSLSGPGRALRHRIAGLSVRRLRAYVAGPVAAGLAIALVPWTAVAQASKPADVGDGFAKAVAMFAFVATAPDEIGLTETQRSRQTEINRLTYEAIRRLGQEMARQKKANVSDVARGRFDTATRGSIYSAQTRDCLAILTSSQRQRAEELTLRLYGERALGWESVARRVGISEARRREIAGLCAAQRKAEAEAERAIWNRSYPRKFQLDLRRLTRSERREYALLQRQMPTASGADRRRKYDRYYRLVVKSIPPDQRIFGYAQASDPKQPERFQSRMAALRVETLKAIEAMNAQIRAKLTTSERTRWDAALGKPFTWPELPNWWG